MTRIIAAIAMVCAASLIPGAAQANGFFIYEQSTSGMGMAGASIAAADEPSAVFYNPAGMAHLKGVQLQLAVTTYIPVAEYASTAGESTSANATPQPVPAVFATWKPLDWLALGFGEFTNFGLAVTWPEDWAGAPLAVSSSLASFNFAPSLALGPWKGLSIGAGLDFLVGSVVISRAYPGMPRLADGSIPSMKLGGSSWGLGSNVGIHYRPIDMVEVGVTYRSQIGIALDPGSVHFSLPAGFYKMVKDQDLKTGIVVPQIIGMGVRVAPIKPLAIELDANRVFWSSYHHLLIEFQDGTSALSEKDWKDAWQFRLGAQYKLGAWTLRTGLIYDLNPIPDSSLDPMLPDADRIDWALGAGYSFWKMRVDAAYMLVTVLDRSVDAAANVFPGTYKTTVHLVSLGATMAF